MSHNEDNDNKINNETEGKESREIKGYNIIFHCEECKKIPLIIPSNINNTMIKYCKRKQMVELITPINLLNMINIKNIKKRDIAGEGIKINSAEDTFDEFLCIEHGKEYINYCNDCSRDICYSCSKQHLNHKLIHFSQFIPSNRDIREGNKILAEMKKDLDKFKQNSKEIIKIYESLIYLKEIILNSIKSVDFKKLNFYTIMNYKNILKIKMKLNEQLYSVISPLSEINSNLLKKIKKNYLSEKNDFCSNEKNGKNFGSKKLVFELNKEKKEETVMRRKFLEILEKSFEFEENSNESAENKIIFYVNKSYYNNDCNSNNIDKKIPSANNFLNLDLKMNFRNHFNNINHIKCESNKKINDNNMKIPYISEYDKSTIMENQETNFIINLISFKFKKKIKKFYLCYRATEDGDGAENFHKKCDFIKNIIIIIQTSRNKKFGGFSSESWDSNNESTWKKDEYAFIFSLNNYKAYDVIKPERAIFCSRKSGPIYGNGEIFIPNNFFSNNATCQEENMYYESKGRVYPLNGEKNFTILQLEAYKVDFEENC